MEQTRGLASEAVVQHLEAIKSQLDELYREEIQKARRHHSDLARARRLYLLRRSYRLAVPQQGQTAAANLPAAA